MAGCVTQYCVVWLPVSTTCAGMAGFVGGLVDSDEEGADINAMDSKNAKGKTR
jgi:hypothetical protein